MSKKLIDPRIKKFKKIIAVDSYTDTKYQYKDQTLTRIDNLSFDNKNFVISYIKNRDMIIASFDLGFGIDEAEIDDMIYVKAYDELGLDPEKEYLINHRKANSDANSSVYNLFIIEPEIIDESCAKTIEKTTYIDLLIPAPLLYEALYTTNTLEASESHCFIYFTMDDAFVTIYKDGEFLYSKSLEFSLTQIYDKYCAMIGEKVDEKKFFETLESEGLKATDSFFQQNIMKLFGEIFLQINDIIIYTKRAYGIDVIQRLFLGSIKSPIIGLGDYGYNYLGIQTYNLDYNFDMKNDEWYVDQFQYMMVQSGLDYIQNPNNLVNLTQTPRPPVFSKRASGQFIISTTVVSLLAIGYPLFFLVSAYMMDAHILKLSSDNESLATITNKYKKILNEKRKTINQNKKELQGLNNIFEGKAKTLTSIYNRKVDYNLKSNLLNQFSIDLTKYELKLEKLSSHEDNFTLYIVSDDDKKITKYIKYISRKYFDSIRNIDIKRISVSEDSLYRGILKVSYI
ncbi:MAG TPA: hypothetical protein ENK79_02885 [Campylobacterales bacterium]|nr:hypothetical protein [Campylobacterales bacterium]